MFVAGKERATARTQRQEQPQILHGVQDDTALGCWLRYTFHRIPRVLTHTLPLERNPWLTPCTLAQQVSSLASRNLLWHVGGENEGGRNLQLYLGAALGVPEFPGLDRPRAARGAPAAMSERYAGLKDF